MMTHRWKLSGLMILCFAVLLIQGCATLNGTVPFKYVPSLASGEPSDFHVGMEKLADKRPADDIKATNSITDVDEKVTAKVLEDFRSSQVFSALDFPVQQEKSDLLMKGEIRRFYWKSKPNPIVFIPYINLLIYFGIPTYYVDGTAQLKISLVNAKTGKTVAEYDKISTKLDSYSVYRFKAGEAGAELADAFRDVTKQIKEAMVSDIKAGRFKTVSVAPAAAPNIVPILSGSAPSIVPVPPSAKSDIVSVIWTSVNVRAGAGNNHRIVTTVKQGDKLTIIGEFGEWFNVRLENGQEGWVSNRVVK